jgi:hypothetical protein
MKFKVNKIAVAVAVSLGTSVVGMKAAQADEILFPYVVASGTVTTIVSTINIFESFFEGPSAARLHYRYYYKNGDRAENNTAPCVEVNERLPSSPNDIVTFDVANRFGTDNLGIIFEDVATSSNVNYGSKSFSLLNITLPVRAFLVVDNNDFFSGAGLFSTADSLAGEAIVLEFVTGAAWGYSAYNAAGVYGGTPGLAVRQNLFDFSDAVETTGEVIADSFVPVALAPFVATGGEFLTKFFVTPISAATFNESGNWVAPGNQLQGNLNARVRLAVQDPSSATQDVVFDRDELPVSGQVPQNVVCVGAVDATSMITEGALRRVPDGGWSNLVVDRGTASGVATDEAVVIKLEYNPAPLQLDGDSTTVPVVGVINNALWLRKGIRESFSTDLQPRVQVFTADLDLNAPAPIGAVSVPQ